MNYTPRPYPESEKTVKIRDYKKRVRRHRRNRKIMLFLFLFAMLLGVMFFAPWFKINKITVEGTSHVTEQSVISASTIGYGRNVFRTSIKKATRGIKALPYVGEVKIVRKFPATIKITVTECSVYGYIKLKNAYVYIDKNGKMLEQSNRPPADSVPAIEKFNLEKYEPGGEFKSKDPGKEQYIKDLFSIFAQNGMINRISVINIPNITDLSFTIDNKLEVYVGENVNLDYKINFLAVKSYESLGDSTRGHLNVSSGDKAVYKQQ